MKTAICYYSAHHGNTKLILDAIAEADPEAMLIDCTKKQEFEYLGHMAASALIPLDPLNWSEDLRKVAKQPVAVCLATTEAKRRPSDRRGDRRGCKVLSGSVT